MSREPRFPGIEWYCDNCNALLSTQKGFDDHKYTWKCRECGYKNSISWDNVGASDSKPTQLLLHFLGFLSYVGFWTAVMLGVSIFALHADKKLYLFPFLIFLGIYLISFIVAVVVEFSLRKTKLTLRNFLFVIFRNLGEDLVMPLFMVKELLSNLFSCITRRLPVKKKYIWHSNVMTVIFAVMYVLIFALEIIIFLKINRFI